ncbi:MAG: formylglycine-generating enzyme family protein, partial [Phormidesmis sp. CAN_BIN36]|nr:formylglycine-generating enzyme family protein [Phormidesmis sp. CAN_BIN36]
IGPIQLPIVYLIQATMLPDSTPLHLAEVFMSGLIERGKNAEAQAGKTYEFVPGVKELLLDLVNRSEAELLLDRMSQYIGQKIGRSIYSFTALLMLEKQLAGTAGTDLLKFADVMKQSVQRLGGEFAAFVDALEVAPSVPTLIEFPPVQTLEFITVQLSDSGDNDSDTAPSPFQLQTEQFTVATLSLEPELHSLEPFEFTVSTLNRGQAGILRRTKWVIQQRQQQAWRLIEPLEDDLILEMVSIPGGQFSMGSPKNELGRYKDESPQHDVEVGEFLMGRYPVTQAQWRVVAELPQSDRPLESDLSYFKGDHRPVETVSWHDATEFCARLSQYTERLYRLPTEAEWEYACRAGTITPSHFGETITTELANYRGTNNKEYKWSGSYGEGPKGEYREETTPVDQFRIANAFGLCDMHGNVWEWCQDHWHENYEGAPVDGISWVNPEAEEDTARVLRGGSWYFSPRFCRSASRDLGDAGERGDYGGFRVVCVAPRTS